MKNKKISIRVKEVTNNFTVINKMAKNMENIRKIKGYISIDDYADITGIKKDFFSQNKIFGWKNLNESKIVMKPKGKDKKFNYTLIMPMAKEIKGEPKNE